MEKKEKWYFTFGVGTPYRGRHVVIEGTADSTREEMWERFGPKWAFQYTEKQYTEIIKRWPTTELK